MTVADGCVKEAAGAAVAFAATVSRSRVVRGGGRDRGSRADDDQHGGQRQAGVRGGQVDEAMEVGALDDSHDGAGDVRTTRGHDPKDAAATGTSANMGLMPTASQAAFGHATPARGPPPAGGDGGVRGAGALAPGSSVGVSAEHGTGLRPRLPEAARGNRRASRMDRCWAAQATLSGVWRAFGISGAGREREVRVQLPPHCWAARRGLIHKTTPRELGPAVRPSRRSAAGVRPLSVCSEPSGRSSDEPRHRVGHLSKGSARGATDCSRRRRPRSRRATRRRAQLRDLWPDSSLAPSGGKCRSSTSRSTSRMDRCWAAQATLMRVWRAFGMSSARRERGSCPPATPVLAVRPPLPLLFAITVVPQSTGNIRAKKHLHKWW